MVAVVAALVGTAIAESGPATTSASIKGISKGVKRALNKSNRAVRIARRTRKQAGPQGIPGPRGQRGPVGVSDVEIVEKESAFNESDTKEVEAECPSGKRVLGGGAMVDGPGFDKVAIDWNAPEGSDAWRAAAHEHDAAANWFLTAYAICADTD